jgi:Fur family ferric uptake transcriptional regulator
VKGELISLSDASSPHRESSRRSKYTDPVRDALRRSEPTNAQELHQRLRSAGVPVGLSTVYRVLHALERDGEIRGFSFASGTTYVTIDHRADRSFEVCDLCGDVHELMSSYSTPAGLLSSAHPVHIHGLCSRCDAAAQGMVDA